MTAALLIAGHVLLAILALPTLAAALYLMLLTLLSARLPVPAAPSRRLRFDIVVPARNEATVIRRCLASLDRIDWPRDRCRVIVVADNCDDATARVARDYGAQVLERIDEVHRGKGYALRLAFERSRDDGWADAIAIVDADTVVSSNLLAAFAARIECGADVVQAHYGVSNPAESWRTGLMAIAYGAFHRVRSRARERLRLSCGLRGNGWCITQRTLEQVPYRAFSLTEDLEYGIALGLAGKRVHYADEADANAEMESRETVAVRQRQRWEDGRLGLIRRQALPLLRKAVHQRDPVAFDLALDLLVLPLSYIVLAVLASIAAAGLTSLWLPTLRLWLWISLTSATGLALHVLRGWQVSDRGLAGLGDLLRAPLFVVWKLLRVLRPHDRHEWSPVRRKDP